MIFWVQVALSVLILAAFLINIPETLPREERAPLELRQMFRNYLEVLCHRQTLGYILAGSFVTAGLFAFLNSASLVYIEHFHIKPQNFGFYYGLNVLLMMAMTYFNSKVVRGIGTERLLQFGIWISTLAGLALLFNVWRGGGLWSVVIPVVIFIGPLAMVGANSMAGILTHFNKKAGTASALAGTMRFGLGGIAGMIINLPQSNSPMPMALTIAICGVLAFASYYGLVYPNLHPARR